MKKNLLLKLLLAIVLLGAIWSCRESFDINEFADVEIINQPPVISGLDDLRIEVGEVEISLNLLTYITDPEGDPVTIISAESGNTGVVTASLDESVLTLGEVDKGTSTISVMVDDGAERDDLTTLTFECYVTDPLWEFSLRLVTVEDGTDFSDYTYEGGNNDGTAVSIAEGDPPYTLTINSGVLDWSLSSWCVLSIEFGEPVDLSNDATFLMEYADFFPSVWDDVGMVLAVFNEDEEEAWIEDPFEDIQNNSPTFSTLEFDLNEYAEGIDLSAVTGIAFEKWGADGLEPPPTIKIKEFAFGKR